MAQSGLKLGKGITEKLGNFFASTTKLKPGVIAFKLDQKIKPTEFIEDEAFTQQIKEGLEQKFNGVSFTELEEETYIVEQLAIKMEDADQWAKSCCFIILELTDELGSRKPIFMRWTPDNATIKEKMVVTSSTDSIKKAMGCTLTVIQLNDLNDFKDYKHNKYTYPAYQFAFQGRQ